MSIRETMIDKRRRVWLTILFVLTISSLAFVSYYFSLKESWDYIEDHDLRIGIAFLLVALAYSLWSLRSSRSWLYAGVQADVVKQATTNIFRTKKGIVIVLSKGAHIGLYALGIFWLLRAAIFN